jgi:hypothetical protein
LGVSSGKELGTVHRNELQAILETLSTSVNTGLNATVTPRDCQILLAFLRLPRPKGETVDRLLNLMTDNLTEIAMQALEDLKRR